MTVTIDGHATGRPSGSPSRRRHAWSGLLLLATAVLTSGCSAPVARYGKSRALDLLDVVPVSVGAGKGLSLAVRATPFLGLGLGYADSWRAGSDELRYGPIWWEEERGIPLYRYQRFQDYADRPTRYDGGYLAIPRDFRQRASTLLFLPGTPDGGLFWFPVLPAYVLEVPWRWNIMTGFELLNVEAGLFLGVVGLRVGVAPLHAFDLLVGLFGFDPAEDDIRPPLTPRWPEPGVEPLSFPHDADESATDPATQQEGDAAG